MIRCGAAHPKDEVPCALSEGVHAYHMDTSGRAWTNPEGQATLAKAPKRMGRPTRGTPKISAAAQEKIDRAKANSTPESGRTDIPAAATEKWESGPWVGQATEVLHRFLKEHPEPFTTPEDIWPLLDAPQEMRAMSVVVQSALRRKWMTEVGAKRIRETHRSRDDRVFASNKIVPVYQSQITREVA